MQTSEAFRRQTRSGSRATAFAGGPWLRLMVAILALVAMEAAARGQSPGAGRAPVPDERVSVALETFQIRYANAELDAWPESCRAQVALGISIQDTLEDIPTSLSITDCHADLLERAAHQMVRATLNGEVVERMQREGFSIRAVPEDHEAGDVSFLRGGMTSGSTSAAPSIAQPISSGVQRSASGSERVAASSAQ